MNRVTPKVLLNSKWTKINVENREKHFLISTVKFDEQQNVIECIIEAVINKNVYSIDWRELKDNQQWRLGWV
ncbi:TIGR02450 family Trp-rich protein [Psychromonas sp.]|uniref:TIGR02450 family Trp-rich protein n=1 Tax=Psychromonas sp. TaxID=1884585 RepID=UPI0039E4170A